MKKTISLIVSFLLVSGVSFAQAQVGNADIYPEQVEINHNAAVRQFSQFFVTSFNSLGGINANLVNGPQNSNLETNLSIIGNYNSSTSTQSGLNNFAAIGIIGDYNRVNLIQDGNDNRALLGLEGNDNLFNLSQIGNDNQYFGAYRTSNATINAEQIGNGLRAVEIGTGGIPLIIRQQGNGANLIINHNN
jgi:hypothetical protein